MISSSSLSLETENLPLKDEGNDEACQETDANYWNDCTMDEVSALWPRALESLKGRMSQPSFETWISPLQIEAIGERSVTLNASSDFNREQILKRYRNDLQTVLSEALGRTVTVDVAVKEPEYSKEDLMADSSRIADESTAQAAVASLSSSS